MKRAVLTYLVFILFFCGWTATAEVVASGPVGEENVSPVIDPPPELRLFILPEGFQLNWKPSSQDPAKVTGYQIVRSEEFSGPYEKLAVVKQGVRQYLDTSAAPDVVYFYKVRAIAGDEYSHFSNIAGGERPSGMP
jgi:hypothetical protein